jgi:NADPH:quinone reductase-like Zn-dependent oxidoreductase
LLRFLRFSLTALQSLSPHVSAESSVLVIGGSGGAGHVALQVARCLGATQIAAICSARNAIFCRSCGATEIIDYTKANNMLLEDILKSPHKPFHFVMDCVSSADPRDQTADYPNLIQNPTMATQILNENYIYRRLGGPTMDWIRAGLERTLGFQWWPNKHEKLFWVRFPSSASELQILKDWCEDGKLRPQIATIYEFTESGIQKAFEDMLSRRIQGKVVVKIQTEINFN